MDYRGKEELHVVTAGAGELTRVQEGIGKGVTGCDPPNPARRDKGGTRAGGRQKRQGR